MKTAKDEIKLAIPRSIKKNRSFLDFLPHEMCIFIPKPGAIDQRGIYVDRTGFVKLLRANKNNPKAVQYLADMLE